MIPITVISCKGFVAVKAIKLHNVFIITPSHSSLIFWIKFMSCSLPTRWEIRGVLDYNAYKLELWEQGDFSFNSISIPPFAFTALSPIQITYSGSRSERRKGCVILRHLMSNKNVFSVICKRKKGTSGFVTEIETFCLIYLWVSWSDQPKRRLRFTSVYKMIFIHWKLTSAEWSLTPNKFRISSTLYKYLVIATKTGNQLLATNSLITTLGEPCSLTLVSVSEMM